uniref:Uncharacterized protein n=1 Tax=Yersinia enterocolitica W22703 TaxID=913028 RepID=F4MYG5_YEREN|nr:unknown protein [Yersinia enterocolitica W22703]
MDRRSQRCAGRLFFQPTNQLILSCFIHRAICLRKVRENFKKMAITFRDDKPAKGNITSSCHEVKP